MILAVPGADLPYCMFHSAYTKRLFGEEAIKNADFKKAEELFKKLNPINNLDNAPENAIIHLSLWDKIMPYKDAVKIAKKLKELGKKPIVHTNYFFGHSLTIATFNNKE